MASTLATLKDSTLNATSNLIPSSKDLFLVVPRLAARAGSYMVLTMPEAFEDMLGGGIAGRAISDATEEVEGATTVVASTAGATITATYTDTPGNLTSSTSYMQIFNLSRVRTFGTFFSYMTSKWALGCLFAGILLNRTAIYGASRLHLHFNWQTRAAIRIVPILFLILLSQSVLRTLKCQMSPDYSVMRYGTSGQQKLDFSEEGGFLYKFSSALLLQESDRDSCLAVNMIPSEEDPQDAHGSLKILWPAFLSYFGSQFVESLSCALEGRPVATETGMGLFEHSLAFAEAEAMLVAHISEPIKEMAEKALSAIDAQTKENTTILSVKADVGTRFNTSPEVLLMVLISTFNSISSQALGVFGLQAKYRLINTGTWACCYMGSFLWRWLTVPTGGYTLEPGVFRFPTVCLVGFLPHAMIIIGIFFCGCVYSVALLLTILSPPEGTLPAASWWDRTKQAHENMQANIQLSGVNLRMHEDFYTTLLRVGVTALTAASEAVYLNEGRRINIGQWTWLEEERMNHLVRARSESSSGNNLGDSSWDAIASGVVFMEPDEDAATLLGQPRWRSGWAKERTTKILKGKPSANGSGANDATGLWQRGGRARLSLNFLIKIFWLSSGWWALCSSKVLRACGLPTPAWMARLYQSQKIDAIESRRVQATKPKELDFWILSDDGELVLPHNNDVDVEAETKRRLQIEHGRWDAEQENQLDSKLYTWFTHGGWWGEQDGSGEFTAPINHSDEDETSTIISSSIASTDDGEDDDGRTSDDPGRRTPTQSDYRRQTSRESTPFDEVDPALDPARLARLLNPVDQEQREEARMLAARLTSAGPVTRSRYARATSSANAHVLTSTRYRPAHLRRSPPSGKLTPVEEAELLEHLIVRFREHGHHGRRPGGGPSQQQQQQQQQQASWSDGAEGLGAGGPMCVVCQSAPRTILAWPCRCLSLCEDCRVSLAMNNFGTCVCCRQEVVGFSRLFVP